MSAVNRIMKRLKPFQLFELIINEEVTESKGHKNINRNMGFINLKNYEEFIDRYIKYRWELHQTNNLTYPEYIEEEKHTFNELEPDLNREQRIVFRRYLDRIEKTFLSHFNQNTKLENLIYLISYYIHEDKTVLQNLTNNKYNKQSINALSKELDTTFLSCQTTSQKEDTLNHYLFQLGQLNTFFSSHEKYLFHSLRNIDTLNPFNQYIIKSHFVYDIIMNQLQICSGKYNLDFWKSCKKMNVNTTLFDGGISQSFVTNRTSPTNTTTFTELFESTEMMEKCIQVLRDVYPPILTEKNKIIGNNKGAIVVWFEILQSKGLIKNVNQKIFASLYSKEFEPISDSTFRKVNPRANDNYKDELNKLLSQL